MEYTKHALEWVNDGVWPPVTTISFADATTLQYSPASVGPGPTSRFNLFSFQSNAASGASFMTKTNLSKPQDEEKNQWKLKKISPN